MGRHLVEAALQGGHEVTLFNRGLTGAELFPGVERIVGDRKGDLSELGNREWDAVLDCVGYDAGTVRKSAQTLKERARTYAFVSTVSVYAPSDTPQDESSATLALPEGADPNEYVPENYGALKALCEREVAQAFPSSYLNLRIGLQIGPYDHTDRFGDWVERIATRSEVLVPEPNEMPWQFIDARDTAAFCLQLIAAGSWGTFNITGSSVPMSEILDQVRKELNPACHFVGASQVWLSAQSVEPWSQLTLWIPKDSHGRIPLVVSTAQAEARGRLRLRPIQESIRDCWAWIQTLDPQRARKAGLPSERESQLLDALKAAAES